MRVKDAVFDVTQSDGDRAIVGERLHRSNSRNEDKPGQCLPCEFPHPHEPLRKWMEYCRSLTEGQSDGRLLRANSIASRLATIELPLLRRHSGVPGRITTGH